MALSDIVDVQITAATRFPTRLGFGTPMVAGFTTAFADRVRTVSQLAEVLALGGDLTDKHPIYLEVQALFAQNPRPLNAKIGRRAGVPSQSIRLTPANVAEGHETTVTVGGVPFSFTSTATATVAEITAALEQLMNPDADAILATGGTSAAAPQVILPAGFDGVIGLGQLAPPRNLTITFSASVDWDASTFTVTGKDAAGRTITEDFAIPEDGGGLVTGAKLFATVTQFDIAAQTGAGGTYTVGVGKIFANADLEVTATDNVTSLTIAADNLGDWFPFNGFDTRLEVKDLTAEPAVTLATDLAAMNLEDSDWYGLIIADAQSQSQIEPAATWIETAGKLYVAHTFDTDVTQDTSADVASVLQLSSIFRTSLIYHRNAAGTCPDAAWMGSVFPRDPGSVTWEFQELTGVVVDSLNSDQITELRSKNASYYVRVRGFNVTLYSRTAAGEWMDVVRFIDKLKDDVGVDVFALLASLPKVPFTAGGISAIGGAVRGVGIRGQRIGGLDPDQELIVITPILAALDPSDIVNRILRDVTFNWRLAGAIHAAEIRGNVSSV